MSEHYQPKLFEVNEDEVLAPAELKMREWVQTYVDSGLLEPHEAVLALNDWRRAYYGKED